MKFKEKFEIMLTECLLCLVFVMAVTHFSSAPIFSTVDLRIYC